MAILKSFISLIFLFSNIESFASPDDATVPASNSFTSQYSEDQLEQLLELRIEYARDYYNLRNERLFYIFVTRASKLALNMKKDISIFLINSFNQEHINSYLELSEFYNGYIGLDLHNLAACSTTNSFLTTSKKQEYNNSDSLSCCSILEENFEYFLQTIFRHHVKNIE